MLKIHNIGLEDSSQPKKKTSIRNCTLEKRHRLPSLLVSYLENLINGNRNIVLVSHGFSDDLYVLQSFGFGLKILFKGFWMPQKKLTQFL